MTEPTAYLDYDREVEASAKLHGTIPHCDSRILHPLGTCEYCDDRPELHAARRRLGLNYTGTAPDPELLPCPAEAARSLETIEKWGGNRRKKPEAVETPAETITLRDLIVYSYANSADKGFWADADYLLSFGDEKLDSFVSRYVYPTKLALIHSEVSEALEELRDGDLAGERVIRYTESGKPEGFASELADAMIRIADLAGRCGIDLEAVIIEKMAYNRSRPFMHGRTI